MNPTRQNLGQAWRQTRFNPLRSLTPERLASALDAWDAGYLRGASLIFETIEQRDAIIRSVMTKRRSAAARSKWQIIMTNVDHPRAAEHMAALEYFYNNLTTTDATDLNVRSGMSGLIRQMMDAIIQRYAAHEIVFNETTDGLTAELRRVPLYFFENRTGRLRFTGPENLSDGNPLEEDGWMITVADGLGGALAICYMFKRLGLQDLLAFSEKFSIPGVIGRTAAAKDSPEGNAMRDSVLAYASEWAGVVYGDDGRIAEPIKVIQTDGAETLPQETICGYMDKMISALVRGADLSTLSAANSAGASLQGKETAVLLHDDCALVSETLHEQLDRLVIRRTCGDETPAARIQILPASRSTLLADLKLDKGLVGLGLKQAQRDLAKRYGRRLAVDSLAAKTIHPI